MSENVLKMAIGAFVMVTLVIAGASISIVATMAESAVAMQKNGADPLDIPCAIGDATERYCELRAASRR